MCIPTDPRFLSPFLADSTLYTTASETAPSLEADDPSDPEDIFSGLEPIVNLEQLPDMPIPGLLDERVTRAAMSELPPIIPTRPDPDNAPLPPQPHTKFPQAELAHSLPPAKSLLHSAPCSSPLITSLGLSSTNAAAPLAVAQTPAAQPITNPRASNNEAPPEETPSTEQTQIRLRSGRIATRYVVDDDPSSDDEAAKRPTRRRSPQISTERPKAEAAAKANTIENRRVALKKTKKKRPEQTTVREYNNSWSVLTESQQREVEKHFENKKLIRNKSLKNFVY